MRQFDGRRCLHQLPGECNVDSVLRDCWCVMNAGIFVVWQYKQLGGARASSLSRVNDHTQDRRNKLWAMIIMHNLYVKYIIRIIKTLNAIALVYII